LRIKEQETCITLHEHDDVLFHDGWYVYDVYMTYVSNVSVEGHCILYGSHRCEPAGLILEQVC